MIAENVKKIQENIKSACIAAGRSPETVTLIAVSKTFGHEDVGEVIHAGVFDIGENYVQEIVGKRQHVADERVRWHFIGHLQSNKVKYIVEWINLIHSVDNENVAAEIQKRGAKLDRTIDVLVEVNTSGEASKFGVKPDHTLDFVSKISQLPNLRVDGLMTIGPFLPDAGQSRPAFRTLKNIFDEVNASGIVRGRMRHLSMGMTHDFAVAIEEGSTMVRIGTAIFGSRQ
jgi:hypothetical protein